MRTVPDVLVLLALVAVSVSACVDSGGVGDLGSPDLGHDQSAMEHDGQDANVSVHFDSWTSPDAQEAIEGPTQVVSGRRYDAPFCAPGEGRCVGLDLQRCGSDERSWVGAGGCSSSDVCQMGECLRLPAGYGRYCHASSPCPTGLGCHDGLCLTGPVGGDGAPCLDELECAGSLSCSSLGRCGSGGPGEGCASDADCGVRAPYCSWDRRCVGGLLGDPCPAERSCSGGLLCGPSGLCQMGSSGDACRGDQHCSSAAPLCGPHDTCQTGEGRGDECLGDGDCAALLDCVAGLCRAAGDDALCTAALPCPSAAPFCGPQDRCQDGRVGDLCITDNDCLAPRICGPDGGCQLGSHGDACVSDGDCAASAPFCVAESCRDGRLGDNCGRDYDCQRDSPFCGPDGHCQRGRAGDPCASDGHCSLLAGMACISLGVCTLGGVDDPCAADSDCGMTAPRCVAGGCASGLEEARCESADDCSVQAPLCVAEHCFDGSFGDPCARSLDCVEPLVCGPDGCQTPTAGGECSNRADCGDDSRCWYGECTLIEGEACHAHGHCPGMTVCGPIGFCQDGWAGDPCSNESDCDNGYACLDNHCAVE